MTNHIFDLRELMCAYDGHLHAHTREKMRAEVKRLYTIEECADDVIDSFDNNEEIGLMLGHESVQKLLGSLLAI